MARPLAEHRDGLKARKESVPEDQPAGLSLLSALHAPTIALPSSFAEIATVVSVVSRLTAVECLDRGVIKMPKRLKGFMLQLK